MLIFFTDLSNFYPQILRKSQIQKYQLAIYFESWERIFVALTIPNLGPIEPVDQEVFETMLQEFDGDRSKVVVTFSKAVENDPDHLADEYKVEKLLKKYGFGEIIFKKARGDYGEPRK